MHRIKQFLVFVVFMLAISPVYADRSVTGNITSTQAVTVLTDNQATATMTVTGTWTGTITPQLTGADGTTLSTATLTPIPSAATVTTITANGQWQLPSVAGFKSFRLLGNTVSSGTAVVTITASPAPVSGGSVAITGNVPVTQATSPWVVSVSSSDLVVGPTSVTSATQVVTVAMAGYYGVGVNITSAGSACTQVAEISTDGGTTWGITQLYNPVTQVYSASTTTTGQYTIICPGGVSNVRMRVSVYGSGTVTDQLRATGVGPGILASNQSVSVSQINGVTTSTGNGTTDTGTQRVTLTSDSTGVVGLATGTNTIGSVKTTDGTTVANVAPATGGQTGQGALQVAATYQAPTFSFGSAVAGTIYDCASYRSVSVQFTTNASANTVQYRTSNDGTNWDICNLTKAQDSTTSSTSFASASVPQVVYGTLTGRYFQLNCSTFVGGTTTGTIYFSTLPLSPAAKTAVAQSGTWTVLTQSVAAATGGYSFLNVSANTAGTTVKSGAGTLHSITINTKGASSNVMTVYDNTAASGTKIGTFDTTAATGTFIFDTAFSTGLECVLATGTSADVTFCFK